MRKIVCCVLLVGLNQFTLQKTSKEDAVKLLGQPGETATTLNADGQFETYVYSYTNRWMGNPKTRVLQLEFREGVLNGYNYMSNFNTDPTSFDFTAYSRISAQTSTKADVEVVMGTPSGRLLCPSQMIEISGCEGVSEVWVWTFYSWDKGHMLGDHVFVSFDDNGMVLKVEAATGPAD
jgi:hypothetical protein